MSIRPQQRPGAPLHPQSQRRRRPAKMLLLIGGLIILVVAGGLAWWLLSPLFLHSTANDANPFTQTPVVTSTPAPVSTPGTVATPVPAGPTILATGKFIDKLNSGVGLANDHGSGNVTIGKTVDGAYQIHFDHLNVTNGPDLHVYLAPTSNSSDAEQVKREGADLGVLTATEGSLNVAIPTDLGNHLVQYHSVVIVCKTFSVIFTTAPLTFSSEAMS